MYQNKERDTIHPQAPYLPKYRGVFEQTVFVGNNKRRMLTFIPDDVRESTAGVLVLGENGTTADTLLNESGWCAIAEQEECKEKLIVCFLEPLQGAWNTTEMYGEPFGDVAYINAAAAEASKRFLYCVHESKLYVMGCKEGGVLANMAAAWNPAIYAGVASVGGANVQRAYLDAARSDFCENLHGCLDPTHEMGLRKGDIPMPAWVIADAETNPAQQEGVVAYWRNACGCDAQVHQLAPDMWEYKRKTAPPYAPNQEKEAYRVCYSCIPGAADNHAGRLLRRIWKDFLYRQRRWMSSPGGDLRVTRDPVRDLNMEYHYECIDGWMREWYVYVPEGVKQHPHVPAPLVLAMHGYTCSGEIYAGNSGWHTVADENQCIVVFPSALQAQIDMVNDCINPDYTPLPAWNVFEEMDRPDELSFFRSLLESVCATHCIDHSRIYATGHSWGSLMTQMLALTMPETFAAVAPCSGVFFGGAEKRMLEGLTTCKENPSTIPIWMLCGEKEEFLMEATPRENNVTGFNIALWLQRNGMSAQVPKTWETQKPYTHGRWNDYNFFQSGVPFVRFTSVRNMPHATMPEMSMRIWTEFFAHFARNEDGTSRVIS